MWRVNPDVTAGVNALFGLSGSVAANATPNGHGRIFGGPVVQVGAGGAVTVYANDTDLDNGHGFNAIQKFSLGTSASAPTAPVQVDYVANPTAAPNAGGISAVRGVTTDLAAGKTDGRFYYTENRLNGGEPGLFVVDPATGNILYDSLTATKALNSSATVDLMTQTRSVAVSPDNRYVATITDDNKIRIVPLTLTLNGVSGLPDLANMITLTTAFPSALTIGRDVDFDAAGNLYAVSSANAMMRAFSRGGQSSYTTYFDGTKFAFGTVGDANGDGRIGPDDFALIDRGFAMHLTGFSNGDFNIDGQVDAADYALIDQAYLAQGAPEPGVLLALRAAQFGDAYVASLVASVPEPGSVCAIALLAPLIGRRRRSR
jgi:hypothetical protein